MEKTVSASKATKVEILFAAHMNGYNRLFGGKLMEWIDVVAAVVARRHSGMQVTTVSVDNLVFEAPAYLNDIVVLDGKLVYVGKTSMEVRVDTFVETADGCRQKINTAYLVLVAIDGEGKPVPVPRLKLETKQEQADWNAAFERRNHRNAMKKSHEN